MTRTGRTAALLAVVASTALVLAGCTGDNDDDPSPTSAGSSTPSASVQSMTRAELEESVFGGASGEREVLGSAEGAVREPFDPVPRTDRRDRGGRGRVEHHRAVHAGQHSGHGSAAAVLGLQRPAPALRRHPRHRARGPRCPAAVAAVHRQFPGKGWTCAPARTPRSRCRGRAALSGIFPPLDPSSTTVTVEIPGFPPVEDVPVTRR